jgi:UDP-N-acetylglucosamine enolpyruvyl transferase
MTKGAVASLPRKGFTLYGAPVLAADLGAGAALVLASMAAEGTAHIEGLSHVDRGYEKSDHQLHLLGASIKGLPCLPFDSTTQYSHLEREL